MPPAADGLPTTRRFTVIDADAQAFKPVKQESRCRQRMFRIKGPATTNPGGGGGIRIKSFVLD